MKKLLKIQNPCTINDENFNFVKDRFFNFDNKTKNQEEKLKFGCKLDTNEYTSANNIDGK